MNAALKEYYKNVFPDTMATIFKVIANNHKSSFCNKTITSRIIHALKRLFSIETFIHFKNKIFPDFFTQGLVAEVVTLKNNINF